MAIPLTQFTKMPLEVLTTPPSGNVTVYKDHYWVAHEGCPLLYKGKYPQAHKVRALAERLNRDGCEIIFVPVAFVKLDISDYQ